MNNLDKQQLPVHQNRQQRLSAAGGVAVSGQMAYATPYQSTPMVATGTPATAVSSSTQLPTTFPPQQQLASYHQAQQFHSQQQQQHQLQGFWANQMQEIEQAIEFKNHSLPLARIKKIMKADEDVRMISAEAPVIFAKACEMFILELTMRAWIHTEENKRRTLQKNDIATAISRTDVFDFLVDIIPRDELKEEGLGIAKATIPLMGSPADAVPYYYVPQHNPQLDQAALYGDQRSRPPLSFMTWPQMHTQQQPDDRMSRAEREEVAEMAKKKKKTEPSVGVTIAEPGPTPPKKKSEKNTRGSSSKSPVITLQSSEPDSSLKGKNKMPGDTSVIEAIVLEEVGHSVSFLADPNGPKALSFVQHFVSPADLDALRSTPNSQVEQSMALSFMQALVWVGEYIIRAQKTRSTARSATRDLDDSLNRHGILAQELKWTKSEHDDEIHTLRCDIESVQDKVKMAKLEIQDLMAEVKKKEEEVKATQAREREEFLRSSEFTKICAEKALSFFYDGFKGCLSQFRANGYSETEHPASFLNVDKALYEMLEEGEVTGHEDEEAADPEIL